jgi:hypothetical protein
MVEMERAMSICISNFCCQNQMLTTHSLSKWGSEVFCGFPDIDAQTPYHTKFEHLLHDFPPHYC